MAVKTLGNVGLKAEWKLGSTAWKDDNDRNMRGLDVLVQCVASAAPTNTPPISPADGSLWMVDSAPTGAWAGQAGKLARYDSGNSDDGRAASWEFWTPKGGWECAFSNASNNHEIYRCLAVPGVGFGWFLYATMSTTAFNAAAFQAYGSNANTLNNNGLAIWSGTTFVAGMESTGVATAMSYRTQSGNVERISNAGAAFFTALTVSGLTQYKIPRVLTAGGQLGDSCFGDDGTVASCTRPLVLNGATRPAWNSCALATMIGHTSSIYSYDSGFGSSPTIARNFFIDGTGVVKALATYSGACFPAYIQIDSNGSLIFGTSISNPTAGATVSDMTTKWSVSKNGGVGFYGVAAPTSRPAVTGSKASNAALASLITQLAACGIISDSTT